MREKIVKFKSVPEFFEKEKCGFKPYTYRYIDSYSDERFKILGQALRAGHFLNYENKYIIEIENTLTKETFRRVITDVFKTGEFLIIAWRHNDEEEA